MAVNETGTGTPGGSASARGGAHEGGVRAKLRSGCRRPRPHSHIPTPYIHIYAHAHARMPKRPGSSWRTGTAHGSTVRQEEPAVVVRSTPMGYDRPTKAVAGWRGSTVISPGCCVVPAAGRQVAPALVLT